MNIEHRQTLKINRNFLVENINFDKLKELLLEYKIFNRYMWKDVDSMEDLLDALPHRGPKAFQNIIEIFRKANYHKEADALESRISVGDIVGTDLFYRMSSKPLGYCLIINNVRFDERSKPGDLNLKRLGSNIDAKSLCCFFEKAGFKVTVEPDEKDAGLTAAKMTACLKEFSRRDFENVDSLIIVIMSHGGMKNDKDIIYGTDWDYIYKTQVIDTFNTENCECLQNKPKVFFFISCRGDEKDYGVPKCLPNETLDSNTVYVPKLSDIFVVHSTLPYHVSMLDEDEGSYFCQALIDVLNKNYLVHDLDTIVKLVNQKLQRKISLIFRTIQVAHLEACGATKKVKFCKT